MSNTSDSTQIQGVLIEDIVKEFGTPVYIYDAEKIVSQLNVLMTVFGDSKIKVKYAVKALSNLAILNILQKNGSGADTVSLNEVKLALMAGFEPEDIIFTPSCVAFDELEDAIQRGVHINIDSLPLLSQFGRKYLGDYPCSIRLNPHIMAGGHLKISTGHSASKFGISVFQMPQILEIVKKYNLKVEGLHIHTGSEIIESEIYTKMASILFDIAYDFPDLQFLDFGGGFKVAYKEGDMTTNMFDLGLKLSDAFKDFCFSLKKKLELWVEPGKFLVSEAGILATTVTVVKETPSNTLVGVNSGLNHLIRPMMYDSYHEIINISNPSGHQKIYSVVGNICETDTFGIDRKLQEVREGDTLILKNAGAYGFSMASQFNSRFRPAEVLVEDGEPRLIRKRDIFEDLLRGQIG